jgi:hypothetical protein
VNINFLRAAFVSVLVSAAILFAYDEEDSPWTVNYEKGTISVADTARRAFAVTYGMIRDYIGASQFDSARSIVECLQKRYATHLGINSMLVNIMLAAGDENETMRAVDHYCTYHHLEFLVLPEEDSVLVRRFNERIAKQSIAPSESDDHQMFILGLLYAKTGRYREAIDSWDEVRKNNPQYPYLKDVDYWLSSMVPDGYFTYGITWDTQWPTASFADRFSNITGFGFSLGYEGRYVLIDPAMYFSSGRSRSPFVYDRNGRSDSTSHVFVLSAGGDIRLKVVEFREFQITIGCPLFYSRFSMDDEDTINSAVYKNIYREYFATGITAAIILKTGPTRAGRIGVEFRYLNLYGNNNRFPEMNDPHMLSVRLCFGIALPKQKRQPIRNRVTPMDVLGGIIGGILSNAH